MNRKSGFTLIELLIVIAIIAILAAILFPVFATAREKARGTACMNNEKQIGLALVQYSQDFDETPPYWNHSNGSNRGGWAGQLYSYIKTPAAYACPDDTNVATAPNVPISYIGNMWAFNNNLKPHSQAQFTAVSVTVAFFEATGCQANVTNPLEIDSWVGDGGNGGNTGKTDSGLRTPALTAGQGYSTGVIGNPPRSMGSKFDGLFPNGRHNLGANYIFFDGHVKWLKSNLISGGENAGSLGCDQDNNSNSSANCAGADGVAWGNAASTDMMGGTKNLAATFSYT